MEFIDVVGPSAATSSDMLEYFSAMAVYYRFKCFAPGVFKLAGVPFKVPEDIVSRMEYAALKVPSADIVRDLFKGLAYTAACEWYKLRGEYFYLTHFIKDYALEAHISSHYRIIIEALSRDDLLDFIALDSWESDNEKLLSLQWEWLRYAESQKEDLSAIMPNLTIS